MLEKLIVCSFIAAFMGMGSAYTLHIFARWMIRCILHKKIACGAATHTSEIKKKP